MKKWTRFGETKGPYKLPLFGDRCAYKQNILSGTNSSHLTCLGLLLSPQCRVKQYKNKHTIF